MNTVLDYTGLIITVVVETFVLFSLKFKVDKAALVIGVSYLIVELIRVLQKVQTDTIPLMSIAWPIASNVIWAVLYYFIYEMKSVYLML